MPVTTETFRNQLTLHRIFGASGIILALTVILAVFQDWNREFRGPQLDARAWEAALAGWDGDVAEHDREVRGLDQLKADLATARHEIESSEEHLRVSENIAELMGEKGKISKYLGLKITGNIAPTVQRIEWMKSLIQVSEGTDKERADLEALETELAFLMKEKNEGETQVAAMDLEIKDLKARRKVLEAPLVELENSFADALATLDKARERLAELSPGPMGQLGEFLRNQPLMDWMNPSIKPRQQYVDDVLTDVNLMRIVTIDRCMSCHTNIDNPAFTQDRMLAFVERRVAGDQNQDSVAMGEVQPVVMLEFWQNAVVMLNEVRTNGAPARRLEDARSVASRAANRLLRNADQSHPVRRAWMSHNNVEASGDEVPRIKGAEALNAFFDIVRTHQPQIDDWSEWYRPLTDYRAALGEIMDEETSDDQRRAFYDSYRHVLVSAYNEGAAEAGRKKLNPSRLMLAHPKLDIYAHPDSKHPIAKMGCTSCHSGSGEETQFEYSTHTPQSIWVDAKSGMIVADYLVNEVGERLDIVRAIKSTQSAAAPPAPPSPPVSNSTQIITASFQDHGDDELAADAGHEDAHAETAGHGDDAHHTATVHDDRWYATADLVENPFGPTNVEHGEYALFTDPATGEQRLATKQQEFWTKEYGWRPVEYHYWEYPMHELRFVQSSCLRCHDHPMQIDREATTLARGRRLFAEVGCINCHPVNSLGSTIRGEKSQADVRQVGPSLMDVKWKLSEDMIASWTWAPKAFRPNTRMPHFFMLENNSSPLDIRRTRAEVGAIAHYLSNAPSIGGVSSDALAMAQEATEFVVSGTGFEAGDFVGRATTLANVADTLATTPPALVESLDMVRDALLDIADRAQALATAGVSGANPALIGQELDAAASQLAAYGNALATLAYEPIPTPELAGSARNGRELFKSVGCMACHANVNEFGLDWVALDLQERLGLDRDGALERMAADAEALGDHAGNDVDLENVGFFELSGSGQPTASIRPDQFNRLQWYLMAYQPERYSRIAPDISGLGTKLLADRSEGEATRWLYDWLRDPSHYSEYSIMPSFRLSEQEAVDLAAYLLTQKHPTYQPQHFEADEQMVDALLVNLQKNQLSIGRARDVVATQTLDEKQIDLGRRMIQHYGCFGCHEVPGFDSHLSVSANLSAWGRRDPHKLDFGYFDHVYETQRPEAATIWETFREGTFVTAPQLDENSVGGTGLIQHDVAWEHVSANRRSYIQTKLHNTRVFDRFKRSVDGEMEDDGSIVYTDIATRQQRLTHDGSSYVDLANGQATALGDSEVEIADVGEPYLKLRMPTFFLTDSDTEALATFVTGLKVPHVRGNLRDTGDDLALMRAKGKLMAISFNCYGCHNVESNTPMIEQYYEVRKNSGQLDYVATVESLVNAPPRILGNGAKAQHKWFYGFLNDIEMIRPWLTVRMPSFNLLPEQTQALVEYLAGDAAIQSRVIEAHLSAVDAELSGAFRETYDRVFSEAEADGNDAAQADVMAKAAAAQKVGELLMPRARNDIRDGLIDLAKEYALYAPSQYPSRDMTPEQYTTKTGDIYSDLSFLRDTYDAVDYPFQEIKIDSAMSDLDFYRGEQIIKDMGCLKCHAFGDWDQLEQVFAFQQIALAAELGDMDDEEGDPYGDDEYGDDEYGDDEYGDDEEDPYGDADEEDPYGDEDGYGEDDEYGSDEPAATPKEPSLYDNISAPNLGLVYQRLQPDYVRQWLRRPSKIMPGTKMPDHFGPDGARSHAANFGPTQHDFEARYGLTVDEQIDLIIRWLYAAGKRGYTIDAHLLAPLVTEDEAAAAAIRAAEEASLNDLKAQLDAEVEETLGESDG